MNPVKFQINGEKTRKRKINIKLHEKIKYYGAVLVSAAVMGRWLSAVIWIIHHIY